MSYDYSASDKQQKVYFGHYLYVDQPWDDVSNDLPEVEEAKLTEDSRVMRRRFRFLAKRLRKQDS